MSFEWFASAYAWLHRTIKCINTVWHLYRTNNRKSSWRDTMNLVSMNERTFNARIQSEFFNGHRTNACACNGSRSLSLSLSLYFHPRMYIAFAKEFKQKQNEKTNPVFIAEKEKKARKMFSLNTLKFDGKMFRMLSFCSFIPQAHAWLTARS